MGSQSLGMGDHIQGGEVMAKRKIQMLRQKIATVGDHSTNRTRRMKALAEKIKPYYIRVTGTYPKGYKR